ncbi:MAG: phosphoribosylanthranilate isomerase, partial [Elusimicrobia bacterium]
MKIKVCGITRPQDARLACKLGAWAVGLVFAPESPRRLSVPDARLLRAEIGAGALAVGVFQNAPRAEILAAVSACRLDAVQFHGEESPADCAGYEVPVFKAFSVA